VFQGQSQHYKSYKIPLPGRRLNLPEISDSACGSIYALMRFNSPRLSFHEETHISPGRTDYNFVVSLVVSILRFWFHKQGHLRPLIAQAASRGEKGHRLCRGGKKTRDLRSMLFAVKDAGDMDESYITDA
jgi:hypothetical protein